MRSRGWTAPSWCLLLLSLLAATPLVVADDKPELTLTTLDHKPLPFNYFEDSDVVMYHDLGHGALYRSEDAGKAWKKVSDLPDGAIAYFFPHPYQHDTAFALSERTKHWKTTDRGKSWQQFDSGSRPSKFQHGDILKFHADDPDRIIFNGMDCQLFCDEESGYTLDGFKTVKLLRAFTAGCSWAKSSPEFTTGDAEMDKSRTICMTTDPFSFFQEDQQLRISDSFFSVEDRKVDEFEPKMDMDKGVAGVVNMAIVKRYLVVATSSFNSDEMALFVTDDTVKWHRAVFPTDDTHDHSHRIAQNGYTVLQSTNYSVQVDVMTSHPSKSMGVLFTSNSNGTYFTENIPYTNRAPDGKVDFEQITGIQGIFLVNIVENGVDVNEKGAEKQVVSKITFDDGRTFEQIKAGDENVHLHSFTELDNVGKVFSSPAPGLVMGNGNTGKTLGSFRDANLFVSDDAGSNWKKALDGPHKYEFGDSGSILVAVKDSAKEDVTEISYSLDHGDKWESVSLPDKLSVKPTLLTTTQDSTSLKFIMLGFGKDAWQIIHIDFDTIKKDKCGDKEMEDWHARVDDKGEPSCLMGHKETFRRRKKDADCFIHNDKFEEPLPQREDCDCSDADFECDYNFQRDPEDSSKCKKVGPIAIPEGECQGDAKKFKGSSGYRLIPGNTCKRTKGEQKDDEVERDCSDGATAPGVPGGPSQPPASGDITAKKVELDTDLPELQIFYLEKAESNQDTGETVIVRPIKRGPGGSLTTDQSIWRSSDHGKTFDRILEGEKVANIVIHPKYTDVIYLETQDKKIIYSIDRGNTFHSFEIPTSPGSSSRLVVHPERKDWLIWVGERCDKVGKDETCFKEASLSTDRGDNWETIARYVEKCDFTGASGYKTEDRSMKQIVCIVRKEEKNDAPLTIMSSNDFFQDDKTTLDEEYIDYATMSEFIMAAKPDPDPEVKKTYAMASVDGKLFEKAHFPLNFDKDHEDGYTVLESSTHAVNLFVRKEGGEGHEYGSIIKSNQNGTFYVLSAANVNSNAQGYVDFEKIAGLEGVVVINTVANPSNKDQKKLQTKISHNDGSEWTFLAPPSKDADGKSFKCSSSQGDQYCALHLHHYTERKDKRNTFAASSAVGLLFGWGNVGAELDGLDKADTFMSKDGGVTWENVKKGRWSWAYGDQGSIIVLVQRSSPKEEIKTKMVSYSVDEGQTWSDYTFSDDEVIVQDITSLRSGTSRNFLLTCLGNGKKITSINLDFTGLTDQACEVNENDSSKSDYYLWSPKHPMQDDDCMFGHVAKYLRKKTERKCFNAKNTKRLYGYETCECSRRDFECAYNFEMDQHGQCRLVDGKEPMSPAEYCRENNATVWYEPSGYRKLAMSTCQGGRDLEKSGEEHPCAGFEEEFEKKHRTSGVAIFFAVVIPFALAGAIGYYVWSNWGSKFGQIRLGDTGSSFDSDQPWVKYPVIAVSAAGAVVAAMPYLIGSLWRSARGVYSRVGGGSGSGRSWLSGGGQRRFTTRDSFARRRGDYSVVDDDEGELLGDDSDEEV